MTATSRALTLTLALGALASGQARELVVLGEHAVTGTRDGARYRGTLEIADDASYTCTRTFDTGASERSAGRARIDRTALVLADDDGRERRYAIGSPYGEQRWIHDGDDEHEVLSRAVPRENVKDFFGRLVRDGRPARWVLQHNRGYVERGEGRWIQRSRQPRPRDIERFKRAGGKTVLSLNGDQDDAVDDLRPERLLELKSPQGEAVNLRAFIREQGLNHVHVNMSAQRAPSDAELVTVFRTLLDDAQRPILVHCRGGSDRTGIVCALYAYEFLGVSKAEAVRTMRSHLWAAVGGTEIQGAYFALYRKGRLRELLREAGVTIPERYRE